MRLFLQRPIRQVACGSSRSRDGSFLVFLSDLLHFRFSPSPQTTKKHATRLPHRVPHTTHDFTLCILKNQSQTTQHGFHTRYIRLCSLQRMCLHVACATLVIHKTATMANPNRQQTTLLYSHAYCLPHSPTLFSTSSPPSSASRARYPHTSHRSSTNSLRSPMSPPSSPSSSSSSSRSRSST